MDQTVQVNSLARLDGTASSDANGDSLVYKWSFVERPSDSAADISDADESLTSFTADKPGLYTIQLIVNDGQDDSIADLVVISTENSPPQAEAGISQTVIIGDTITLDGSSSSDVDGDPLTFSWSFLKRPENSIAALSDAASITPQFVVDQPGDYQLQLIVSDGKINSQTDTVIISTENSVPVANAGKDLTAPIDETVLVDGTTSFDVDGNPLTYQWALLSRPPGSTASPSETISPHLSTHVKLI